MEKITIKPQTAERHNLPSNMTRTDFNAWQILNGRIQSKEQLGWNCEADKNQRFSLVNRYYVLNNNGTEWNIK